MTGDVVEEQLHHLQLVERQQRHALCEPSGVRLQLGVGHALEDHPVGRRLGSR